MEKGSSIECGTIWYLTPEDMGLDCVICEGHVSVIQIVDVKVVMVPTIDVTCHANPD